MAEDDSKEPEAPPQCDAAPQADGATGEDKDAAETSDAEEQAAHPLEALLAVYPVREAAEDPGWAVKTVWVWVGFALFCIVFIVWLLAGGFEGS